MKEEERGETLAVDFSSRLKSFISEYGEKGKKVLKAALIRAREVQNSEENVLGDFDFRGVRKILEKSGEQYNPGTILGIMEKKYGIIETSYKSSKQHWWRFYDIYTVERELGSDEKDQEEEEDSYKIIMAMYASLEPKRLLESLRRLSTKPKLDYVDKKLFKKVAFEELPLVEEVLKKMGEMEGKFAEQIKILKEIVRIAEEISIKLIKEQ
ncbi:MAG: hypothetical protein QXM14_00775 [Fervidicoccaceae archaeon]